MPVTIPLNHIAEGNGRFGNPFGISTGLLECQRDSQANHNPFQVIDPVTTLRSRVAKRGGNPFGISPRQLSPTWSNVMDRSRCAQQARVYSDNAC